MTNSKSTAPKGATRGSGQRAAAKPPEQQKPNPAAQQPQQRRSGPSTIDEAIAKAQHGRVNITPEKAIEMAGQLYNRKQYGQAERVCRQIIAARPANADAHNILGVTLAATGRFEDAVTELKRAIKINSAGASYYANLGE